MEKKKYRIRHGVKAGRRAGKPQYSLPNRYYPEYMPTAMPGKSEPIIGLWHMRRVLRWKLGYIPINGVRNDEWLEYPPERIAYFHELIKWADKVLKKGEDEYYAKLKEQQKEDYAEIRNGILSDIYDQTEEFLEKRKQCLNPFKGEIDMAKMSFDEMMNWAKNVKEYTGSGVNFWKVTQGIHCIRMIAAEDQDYFLTYTQHDCGQQKDFRSWMCWDYIIDNKEIREYFDEKELLTQEDVDKAKKFGDPVCSTLDALGKYMKNREPLYNAVRTKTRCIMNVFYIFQAYPTDVSEENRIMPGNYILEKSAGFNKLIISAMNKEIATDMDYEGDPLSLVSAEDGKLIALQVEGEGIGKNKRTYTVDFKGKRGPIVYTEKGTNPFQKGAERLTIPDDFKPYNLLDVAALRFLPYQEVINQLKAIPLISKVMEQVGYNIPGDEPSDNPLDDNYDKNFAKKVVGKPIKQISENSWTKQIEKKTELTKEKWEDEEDIKKDKKKVSKIIEVEEDEDPFFENAQEEDIFEKAVPKSDPKKEVITNAPKKRKIF